MAGRSRHSGAMHVVTNTIRRGDRVYTAHLLRRSYREGGKVKKETLANLSHLPEELIELIRGGLHGQRYVAAGEAFELVRSLPAGHVEAALEMVRRLELARLLDRTRSRERALCLAMIVQRLLGPGSKLAMSRAFSQSTLASELAVADADEDELYAALDWLLARQGRIETALARRHLREGTLVLYDVSSSYFEGRACPLAQLGYSRDRRRGSLQVVYGLLCDRRGCPVAVEVFEGSLHDDKTLPTQIEKLRTRFRLTSVIVVSDRGVVTKANLALLRDSDGAAWITALKAPQVQRLVKDGALQLSLFDEHNLAEIVSDDYPGERLVVCRNPLVAAERARKREDLLHATERALSDIQHRVEQGTLAGEAAIGLAVGEVWNRWRVRKHFRVEIGDTSLAFARKQEQIVAETALDGIYVLRTSVPASELAAPDVVRAYKQLKEVERAFRTLKGPLELRPIHHRLEDRVKAHVFLCMLGYYLAWHLRQAWKPLLFDDEQPPVQADPVAKARRSPQAERKAHSKRTGTGERCHSLPTLLDELATRTRNTIRLQGSSASFDQLTTPTQTQARALTLVRDYTPTT
ncbi:MAG TPA: IS1634 family transposase [Gaiellaceae bacterium]|nr:IS1634 family transposase [Gaiellaceae bacterium]